MKILQTHPHLNRLGITRPNRIYWQLNTPQLYEEAVQRHEGYVAHLGPLTVKTGNQTSLAHRDRFIVDEQATRGNISWGEVNRAFSEVHFDKLLQRMAAYFNGLDVFVQDGFVRASADGEQMPIRVITETAWHNLFVRNNYLHPELGELDNFIPQYTVLHAPGFRAIPERDGTNSDVFVILHFSRKLILIGGTSFAGEIQKAIFSVMNYLLPCQEILTLECASSMDDEGNTALFIGIDGSGKTTLATDHTRLLIGDAEHGWDDDGIFSIGRGCYAHVLGLTKEESPAIWQVTRQFGTILENVVLDTDTRYADPADDSFTENIRASYPVSHLLRATREGVGKHPRHIFLLAKDGYGVLPLVSKLNHEQAHYYFLSGYTSELHNQKHGKAVMEAKFSSCYGAPFMPLHPGSYARMFASKIKQHNVNVWLVNTGWYGGTDQTGKRIPLEISRQVLRSILMGKLETVDFKRDAYFGLMIPTSCPKVPEEMLNPVDSWVSESVYASTARQLLEKFELNFAQYRNEVDPMILAAQPKFS